MSFKKPFNQVEGLFSSRREIDKKIEKIQKDCNHSSKSIKQIQERLDSTTMVIRYVCDDCCLIVGIPNNDNLQIFLKQ